MINAKTIEEIKKRLIKTYDPLEMYLFGSYAWGTPREESDLDLLIVLDHCDPKDRYKAMTEGHKALFDFRKSSHDILVVSKDEFEEGSKDKARIFYIIKKKGKRIYARA